MLTHPGFWVGLVVGAIAYHFYMARMGGKGSKG